MKLRAFISYAKEDQAQALACYERLEQEGFDPWIDRRCLLPGQNWEFEIDRAMREAHVVILLMSPRSVSKRGFVQREANEAIERLRYKLPDDIYVVPLVLDPCIVPPQIAGRLQYIDLNEEGAWRQVVAALRRAAEQQSIEFTEGISQGPFQVFSEALKETWEGMPGHDVEVEFPRFESATMPDQATELSTYFRGRAVRELVDARQGPWDQDAEFWSAWGNDVKPVVIIQEGFGITYASPTIVSLTYDIVTYSTGAAHHNSHFKTFNFFLAPRVGLIQLEDLFEDPMAAGQAISDSCLRILSQEYWDRVGEMPDEDALRWMSAGAGPKLEAFQNFTLGPDGVTLLFGPYEVAPYALGRWAATVPFLELIDFLRPGVRSLLPLSREQD